MPLHDVSASSPFVFHSRDPPLKIRLFDDGLSVLADRAGHRFAFLDARHTVGDRLQYSINGDPDIC
jgi:hypothetical protein